MQEQYTNQPRKASGYHLLQPGDIVTLGTEDAYRITEIKSPDEIGLIEDHEPISEPDIAGGYYWLKDLALRDNPDATLFVDAEAFAEVEAAAQAQARAEAEAEAEAEKGRREEALGEQRKQRAQERIRAREQQEARQARERIEANPLLRGVDEDYDYGGSSVLLRGGPFMVPARAVTVLYGKTTAGKTFATVDLACCLASGTPWLGLDDIVPRPTNVAFIQLEGDRTQVQDRINAWCVDHPDAANPRSHILHSRPTGFDWDDPDLVDHLTELDEDYAPSVVIIDNLDAGRPHGGNLTDGDVGRIYADVLPALCALGWTVILVAHPNAGDDNIAGLSRQHNAVEAIIHVETRKSGRVAVLEKCKDAPGHPEIAFSIEDSAFVSEDSGLPVGVVRVGRGGGQTKEEPPPVAEVSDDDVMLATIRTHPGESKRKLRELTSTMKGGNSARDAALERLISAGLVRVETVGQAHRHVAV
jgi:hypothetical protein